MPRVARAAAGAGGAPPEGDPGAWRALATPLPEPEGAVLLANALVPNVGQPGYARKDVLIANGKIAKVEPAETVAADAGMRKVDCTERMLLPGFVNGHTHSVEHWARGLIKPLPLELWVLELLRHEPRGQEGWYGSDSFLKTPAAAIYLSALHCGVEALLSGTTAILDHLFVRDLEDVAAAVEAYKALGMRAVVAPMLGDDKEQYSNYIPTARDAAGRNAAASSAGCSCCAMGEGGAFRLHKGASDPEKTRKVLELWEAAVQRFHDPENGISIAIGPVSCYSASAELLRGAAELRKRYNLLGHIHLLETRAQALMAKEWIPGGSAVKLLRDTGFLDVPGTTCAHCCWLDDEEMEIMAAANATAVHNPASNLRLGSGIMPLYAFKEKGVRVCLGADGACSSDGQDMLEILKLATILPCAGTAEYRDWPTAHETLLRASKAGYEGMNMGDRAGAIAVGMEADCTLWDLTSLALLPRTDPLSLLTIGSRTQAPGSGSVLDAVWVRGVQVVAGGAPAGVDLAALRGALRDAQPAYRDPASTDPSADSFTAAAEVEYRAAMGLDRAHEHPARSAYAFPPHRVHYGAALE